jgi:hypothetical protein
MRACIVRILLHALAVGLLAAAPAAAQEEDTVPAAPRRGGIAMISGLRVGWPQKLSGYVGIGIPRQRFESGYTGWAVTVEPGLGGGLVGAGYTTTGGLGMTWRSQASVLRTWGDPWVAGPGQTYAGLDVRAIIAFVGISVGGYVRVPEDGADPGVLLTAGLVVGN